MNTIIDYFLKNSRLNYTLLLFIIFLGVSSYIKIPKELFPNVSLNVIQISGKYAGSSAASLNSFAVSEIEDKVDGVEGIEEIISIVRAGSFSIMLELKDGAKPMEVLGNVKDAISQARSSFPSDMDEPIAMNVSRKNFLLSIALSSHQMNQKELLKSAKELKTKLYKFKGINEVIIYGDSKLQLDIALDTDKIRAFGLNPNEVISSIRKLSYIFPVGLIEESGNHLFLSADDSKLDVKEWENSLIGVGDKKIYLRDIAQIKLYYPKKETLSRFNGNKSYIIRTYKDSKSNAISMAKDMQKFLDKYRVQNSGLILDIAKDKSTPIRDRLNTVISNISFGLILVGLSMFLLISQRISIVVSLGIPFSFIIGITALYYIGYSLNMVSLLAALITIGIVVDDAIVVSENIQRHIDEGLEVSKAVLVGTKEMIMPVMVASFTTIFAFMPLLQLSGKIGIFIMFIPIVVTILIFASLIESFIFLPLHAKHLLKPKDKMLDWTPINNLYERILHFLVRYKKIFLFLFLIIVPILTVVSIKKSHFQFFPKLDSDEITLSVRFDNSMSLKQSDKIAKVFEKRVLENKKKFFIKNVETTVGYFKSISGSKLNMENSFTLTLNLEDYKEDNFIQKYLNPIFTFSFDFEQKNRIRTEKSYITRKKLRAFLAPLAKKYSAKEFNLMGRRIGIIKTDIVIDLSAKERSRLYPSLLKIKEKLFKIEGVTDITDNAKLGYEEYRYKINPYGEQLGLSDESIATSLSSFFLERNQGKTVSSEGIVNIKTLSINKDSIKALKEFKIPLNEGKFVSLKDVVEFDISRDFEKIEKRDGKVFKSIYANVDMDIITPNQVIIELEKFTKEIEKSGVEVIFGGEREQNKQFREDMKKAGIISLFLIFITLLINFPSIRISFIILSVIPFTILGAIVGHFIMGINLTMPSIIGIFGLAGVVINDGIIMLDFLKKTTNKTEFFKRAKLRVRPILITSITTFLGLATLIFYPSGQGVILQPLAISLGFGLLWGTILNLFYLPALYAVAFNIKE